MEAQAVKIFLKPQQPVMTNHEILKKGYADSIVDDVDKKKRRRLYALIISPQQQASLREQTVMPS